MMATRVQPAGTSLADGFTGWQIQEKCGRMLIEFPKPAEMLFDTPGYLPITGGIIVAGGSWDDG